MDARLVIEPANAFTACIHAYGNLTGHLAQAIDDLKAAPRGPSFSGFRAYWEADERFHRLIAEQADGQFLLSAYHALGGQAQRFRFFGGLGVTDFAIAEHTEILRAFVGVKHRSQHDSEVRV